jgi:hypothetical protein
MLKMVRSAMRTAMQSREISFLSYFGAFSVIPQKTRLLLSSGVPRT